MSANQIPLDRTKEWIERVDASFRELITDEYVLIFHTLHVARVASEGKTPVTLDAYRSNAESFILRHIELFRQENENIQAQRDIPCPERKRLLHEKEGLYQIYKEIIIAAGNQTGAVMPSDTDQAAQSSKKQSETYLARRSREAKQRLLKDVHFAYQNVTCPTDKATLLRMMRYLVTPSGENPPVEIKFFDHHLQAFRRRGLIPSHLDLELNRRANVTEARKNPEEVKLRVVSLPYNEDD